MVSRLSMPVPGKAVHMLDAEPVRVLQRQPEASASLLTLTLIPGSPRLELHLEH